MFVEIVDGQLKVDPFDLRLNNSIANIGGMTGVDGSLDYKVKMDVPAGQIGAKVNSLIGSLTGEDTDSETIQLNIGVGGSYDSPTFNLLGADGKETATKVATQKASDLIKENTGVDVPVSKEELNKEAMAQAREQADKILAEAQKQADQIKLEADKNADRLREEAKEQNDKLIKEAGSNVFKKTGAQLAGQKLIDEAEKQAQALEKEGDKQAEAIMAKAREKADALLKNASKQ
jgi:vacuolar-type H+-ATPase subunit H